MYYKQYYWPYHNIGDVSQICISKILKKQESYRAIHLQWTCCFLGADTNSGSLSCDCWLLHKIWWIVQTLYPDEFASSFIIFIYLQIESSLKELIWYFFLWQKCELLGIAFVLSCPMHLFLEEMFSTTSNQHRKMFGVDSAIVFF
jgi:hypothetical protein